MISENGLETGIPTAAWFLAKLQLVQSSLVTSNERGMYLALLGDGI